MNKHILLTIFLIGLICPLVLAATNEKLLVKDCGFSNFSTGISFTGCGKLLVTCNITDTLSGGSTAPGVNWVKVTLKTIIGDVEYPMTIISGNRTKGIWGVNVTIEPAPVGGNNSFSNYLIKDVKAQASENLPGQTSPLVCDLLSPEGNYRICYLNSDNTYFCETPTTHSNLFKKAWTWIKDTVSGSPPGCELTMLGQTIASNCSCESAQVVGACTTYNTQNISWGAMPGCEDRRPYVQACDYCDPLWTPYYSSCDINNYSIMTGAASKYYTHALADVPNGTFCCGLTTGKAGDLIFNHNGGSDCESPPDSGLTNVGCSLDSWLQYGGDAKVENKNYMDSEKNFMYDQFAVSSVSNSPAAGIQPLIFDFDGDGINEILFYKVSTIYAYTVDPVTSSIVLDKQLVTGNTFTGQPATFGIWKSDDQGVYSCDVGSPPCNPRFAVVSNANSIALYRVTNGSIIANGSVSIGAGYTIYSNSGLACEDDYCYVKARETATGSSIAFKIDMSTGTKSQYPFATSANSSFWDNLTTRPMILPNSVVFYGDSQDISGHAVTTMVAIKKSTWAEAYSPPVFSGFSDLDIKGVTSDSDNNIYVTYSGISAGITTYYIGKWIYTGVSGYGYDGAVWLEMWHGHDSSDFCLTSPVNTEQCIAYGHYNGVISDVASYLEYLGRYNWVESGDVGTWAATKSDFDPSDTLQLADSASIASSGTVHNTPVFIDSNGDGSLELWYADSIGIKVLDVNLNLIASLNDGNAKGVTFASDVDGDGLSDFVYENSTFFLKAVKLNTAGNVIVNVVTPFNLSGTNAPTLAATVFSTYSEENEYFLTHTNSTTGIQIDKYRYSGGTFVYIDSTLTGLYSSTVFFIGRMYDDTIRAITSTGMVSGGGGARYLNFFISNLDYNETAVAITAASECCANAYIWPALGQIMDYFGTGYRNQYIVGATVTQNAASIGTLFTITSMDGTTLVTSNKMAGASSFSGNPIAAAYVDNNMRFIAAQTHMSSSSGSVFGAKISTTSINYSTVTGPDNVGCTALLKDGTTPYWLCENYTSPYNYKYKAVDSLGGADGNFNTWRDLDGVTVPYGALFFLDFNGDGNDELLDFGYTDNVIRLFAKVGATGAGATSFIECLSKDFSGRLSYAPISLSGTQCKIRGGITAANDQGTKEIYDLLFTGAGLYSVRGGQVYNFTSNSVVIPVDLNGDGYGDVIETTGSNTKMYISRKGAAIVEIAANVSIYNLQPCTVDATGKLTVGIWASALNPTMTSYTLKPGDGTTLPSHYPKNMFTYNYKTGGPMVITAKACDASLDQCAYANCSIISPLNESQISICSWDTDGDFDWPSDEPVSAHNWVTSPVYKDAYPNDNGEIEFVGDTTLGMTHKVNCSVKKLTITMRAKTLASTLLGLYVSNKDGSIISKIELNSGSVLFTSPETTSTEGVLIPEASNRIGIYALDTYDIYTLEFDLDSKTWIIYIDGEASLSGTFLTDITSFEGVNVKLYYSGSEIGSGATVDYIVMVGYGVAEKLPEYAIGDWCGKNNCCNFNGILESCQISSPAYTSVDPYPNLGMWCDKCGGCDYDGLNFAISLNSDCYKEAMSYCVNVAYPKTQRMLNVKSNEGVMVCSTVLGANSFVTKVAKPIGDVAWQIIVNNLWTILIIVIFLIIFFGVASSQRGR